MLIQPSIIPRPPFICKEPKTWNTVPLTPAQDLDQAASDKPKSRVKTPKDHPIAYSNTNKSTTIQKKRCLLIHDDFHDHFVASKFSSRYEVKCYKMPLLSTIKQEITNVIKIWEYQSDLIVLHIGHKDLWIGHKIEDIIKDLKQIISGDIVHSEAKICVSLIIPGQAILQT